MVAQGLYFAFEQPERSGGSPNQRLLRRYKESLNSMREMVLHKVGHTKLTQKNLTTLERDLSEIIGGVDKLRYASDIDEFLSSPDGLLEKLREARRCLNVVLGMPQKTTSTRFIEARYKKFDDFADFLFEAMNMINL